MIKLRSALGAGMTLMVAGAVGCAGSPAASAPDATGTLVATADPSMTATTTSEATPTAEPTATASPTPPLPSTTLNPAKGYPDLAGWIVFEHFGQAPDGSTSELDFNNRMIWLVKADGSDLHELAPGSPVDGKSSPDISPDGTKVAFSTWDPLALIYEAPIEGGEPTLLSTDCSGQLEQCQELDPAYSADATRIAFVHLDATGTAPFTQIGVRDLESGDVIYLEDTRFPLADGWLAQPAWSPNGDELVYYRVSQTESDEHLTDARLFIASVDGSDVRELPQPEGRWAADPDWTSDGSLIVFSTLPNRESEGWSDGPPAHLYTIRPDGTELIQLGSGWAPSWTSDGQIMFWGNRSWALMNADGTDAAHINQPELTWFGDQLGYGYAAFLQPTE